MAEAPIELSDPEYGKAEHRLGSDLELSSAAVCGVQCPSNYTWRLG